MYYNIRNRYNSYFLKRLLQNLLNFLLPRTKQAEKIAKLSAEELLKTARPANKPPITDVHSVFSYNNSLIKNAIWLLKYSKNQDAVKIFGEILGSIATEWLEDLRTFENFDNPMIIPIPMGKVRLRERGKNHCESICEEMLKIIPLNVAGYEPQGLRKIRETKSQTKTKNRIDRLKNLSNSFEANPKIVFGRNVILVDDVVTTGATIEEARKTLLGAGARKVIALTIAH